MIHEAVVKVMIGWFAVFIVVALPISLAFGLVCGYLIRLGRRKYGHLEANR